MTYPQASSCERYQAEPLCPIVVCDAGRWLRPMRLPGDAVTDLLRMPVGDAMVLFEFDGLPLSSDNVEGVARARIERREYGVWRFDALWTFGVGNASRRGSIYAVGEFSIHSPSMLSWDVRNGQAMRRLLRIVRLDTWLTRMVAATGNHPSNNG